MTKKTYTNQPTRQEHTFKKRNWLIIKTRVNPSMWSCEWNTETCRVIHPTPRFRWISTYWLIVSFIPADRHHLWPTTVLSRWNMSIVVNWRPLVSDLSTFTAPTTKGKYCSYFGDCFSAVFLGTKSWWQMDSSVATLSIRSSLRNVSSVLYIRCWAELSNIPLHIS